VQCALHPLGLALLSFVPLPEPNTIEVDLSRSNGAAFGVRFGWQGGGASCALQAPGKTGGNFFCTACSPVTLKTSMLPANLFMAKIGDGKCKCMPPQVCNE